MQSKTRIKIELLEEKYHKENYYDYFLVILFLEITLSEL